MAQPTTPRQNRPRHQSFPARSAPGSEAKAGVTVASLPVSLTGPGQGSAVRATPLNSPPTQAANGPKAPEWGWGHNIAVGVIKHVSSGIWQSWLCLDGAMVRSLTAHKDFWAPRPVP